VSGSARANGLNSISKRRNAVATGVDPDFYAHRERSPTEVFPWSHLHGGAGDEYLARQYDDVFTQIGTLRPAPAALAV
jgi:hypothetical protein